MSKAKELLDMTEENKKVTSYSDWNRAVGRDVFSDGDYEIGVNEKTNSVRGIWSTIKEYGIVFSPPISDDNISTPKVGFDNKKMDKFFK